MDDERFKTAIADMARNDPDAATLAAEVYSQVGGEEGVEAITLSAVQRFAWYDVHVSWMIDKQERRDVLAAGAALFDALGLDRYASVFRSSQTATIGAAHQRSPKDGLEAYQGAYRLSGINPPDLDDFAWGDVMGGEENSARHAAEIGLEQAMDDGRMFPGRRGWKTTARAITMDVLDSDHPEIPGQSWRSAILTERAHNWLSNLEGRSPEMHAMLSGTVNRLLAPVPPPPDLEHHLAPVTWFLDYTSDGAKMTDAGYLPTAMVRDGAGRFGWDKGWSSDSPTMESDSNELMTVHQLLLDARAVRHHKGLIKRTAAGSRMSDDPEHMWRTLTASLTLHHWFGSVAQVYTLLLLSGEEDADTLCNRSRKILTEFGYRFGNEPPGEYDVKRAWWTVSRPLEVLGGLTEAGHYPSDKYTLSPFGEATLLERLRLDITGPERYP